MYSNKHLNLNRYFAFAFVFFAVLSGMSDHYSQPGAANAKGRNFVYFLKSNNLLAQSSVEIAVKSFASRHHAFTAYIDSLVSAKAVYEFFIAFTAAALLFLAISYTNNKIIKNELWRKTVF